MSFSSVFYNLGINYFWRNNSVIITFNVHASTKINIPAICECKPLNECSSVNSSTGNAVYGNLTLKNSLIKNLKDYLYLWYPTSECVIEKNVFYNSGRIETMTRNANIIIDNNFFRNDISESSSVTGYAVQNAATYESSSTTLRKNTFFNTDKVAISLPAGYTSAKIDAKENFWNTQSEWTIKNMIYDKEDDLNSASAVDYSSFLTSAHENTPAYNIALIVPSGFNSIQAALDSAASGDSVLVEEGTYAENIIWPNVNGIKLIGMGDSSTTIINPLSSANPILSFKDVNGAGVSIIDSTTEVINFTFEGINSEGLGVSIELQSPTFNKVHITKNKTGLSVNNSSFKLIDSKVSNNYDRGAKITFETASNNALIDKSIFTYNGRNPSNIFGGGLLRNSNGRSKYFPYSQSKKFQVYL